MADCWHAVYEPILRTGLAQSARLGEAGAAAMAAEYFRRVAKAVQAQPDQPYIWPTVTMVLRRR